MKTLVFYLTTFIGCSAAVCGAMMTNSPNGETLLLPLSVLKHSPFHVFMIPGLVLLFIVGGSNWLAGLTLLLKKKKAHLFCIAAGIITIGWIVTQQQLTQVFSWLQLISLFLEITVTAISLSLVRKQQARKAIVLFFISMFVSVGGAAQDSLYHIYFTIDDGPSAASRSIAAIADSLRIPLNIFIIGQNVYQCKEFKQSFELYRLNSFIETGNHSFNHASNHFQQYYLSPDSVNADFKRNEDSLHFPFMIARLPGRNTWRIDGRKRSDLKDAADAADSLAASGYRVFGWDLEWRYLSDTAMLQLERWATKNQSFTRGHLVILCHEWMFDTPEKLQQLELFVKEIGSKKNYRLERLSSYP